MKRIIIIIILGLSTVLIYGQESVTTNAATNVASTTATLNATGNNLNASKTYYVHFYYGPAADHYANNIKSSNFTGGTSNTFSVNITGLSTSTQYFFTPYLYEADVTPPPPFNDVYLGAGTELNFTTTGAVTQATNITFSSVTSTTMTVSWTRGSNGDGVIVLAKAGSTVIATPTDGNDSYTANSAFGSGSEIGTGNYVVFKGDGTSVDVTNLSGDTEYSFRVFEYTGSGGSIDYLETDDTDNPNSITTPPSLQASSIVFSSLEDSSLTISWTDGNGDGRIVAVKEGAQGTIENPVYGTEYTPSNDWSDKGDQLGSSGYYIVYDGKGSGVTVDSLKPGTNYWVQIFEYSEPGPSYNTSTATDNPDNESTIKSEPSTQASDITFSSVAATTMTVNWTRGGDGDGVLVIARQGAAPPDPPSDGTTYSANSSFGSGDQIGSGNYVVFVGDDNSVDVSTLTAGNEYYFRVYEYNNSGSNIDYLISSATDNPNSQTTPCTPPTVSMQGTPITSINASSATFNGNITSVGGGSNISERGFHYSTNSELSTFTELSETGTLGTGTYSNSASGTLTAETQYYYRAYAINDCDVSETAYSHTSGYPSFWTLSADLSTHAGTFTSAANSLTEINLTFSAASTITNAEGYIILMKSGATAPASNPVDGTSYSVSDVIGDGTVVAIISNTATTTTTIGSLTMETQYSFKLVPFNWDESNTETYNYKTDGDIPTVSDYTYFMDNSFTGTGDWDDGGNWDNGDVPYSAVNATITSGTCSVDAAAACNNLSIEPGANLTIETGVTLSVGGDMTINADATGMGSYLEEGTGTTSVTGTITSEIYIGGTDWHYISSPLLNETVGDVLTGYNVKYYDEPNGEWAFANTETVMSQAKGFSVKHGTGNQTVTFTGALNSGSISINTTQDNTDGWNLVGNPYPSAIDWNASSGWTKNGVLNGIYFFDSDNDRYATYVGGSGTNGGTQYIPPLQGFFVSCSGAGSLGMTNAVRVHNSQAFWKKETKELEDVLRLQVSGNGFDDDIIVRFNESASIGFDGQFDAFKWFSPREDVGELYTVDTAKNEIAINTQPRLDGYWSGRLGFKAGASDTYTISADNFGTFNDSTAVYLEDISSGTWTNLRTDNYVFASDAVKNTDRFKLHVFPKARLWEGNTTEWNSASNWDLTTVPDTNEVIIIPSNPTGGNLPVIAADAKCYDLVLLPDAQLTLNSGINLRIDGDLVILDNASFVDNGNMTITGSTKVEKSLDKNRWWYLTTPVSDATSEVLNAEDGNTKFYYWNETNTGEHGWNRITDNETELFGGTLPLLTGYATQFVDNDTTIEFIGTGITGTQSINVTRTTGVEKEGFNLVGNPYPSAVNWDTTGVTKTNIENRIWYRSNSQFADYNGESGFGTNGGQKYIPPLQAFWIRVVEEESSGSLGLTNATRLHNDHEFYKTNDDKKYIRLAVESGEISDESVIAFMEGAKKSFDKFDTDKMNSAETTPALFSQSDEDFIDLSVNVQPEDETNFVLPLNIQVENGSHKISVRQMNLFEENEFIYLEDMLMGEMINLKNINEYHFSGPVTAYNNRFNLHFNTELTNADFTNNKQIIFYAFNDLIYIHSLNNVATNIHINVYDLLGRVTLSETQFVDDYTTIQIDETGVYIVELISGESVLRKEIYIK